MEFEWDENKNQANKIKHGLDFREAIGVFEHPGLIQRETKHGYGEERFSIIGTANGRALFVVYTIRGSVYRIISARRASRDERRAYSQI
ncbi:MAG: BrnT family toxin [SAR202 cluster bacterium]|nr:BrnT family toxin [SAR202 cluster bacterium]